ARAFCQAAAAIAVILFAVQPWRVPLTRTTLAWCVWFANWFVILAVWVVAIEPLYRVDFLHILFIGGFTLLIFAVGTRVTLSHGGHALAQEQKSWPIRVGIVTGLIALLARIGAPFAGFTYFAHLAWAAILWIGGVLFWGVYMFRLIRNRPEIRAAVVCAVAAVATIGGAKILAGQASSSVPLKDPVALLAKQLQSGEVKLDYSSNGWGYLPSLLDQLGVNKDSQILVFSKTSFQLTKIGPKTPRAIYFNDKVAVGSVQDGTVFELTALDPDQGLVFYTMDTQKAEKPRFERRFSECLNCHGPAQGLIVSSVYPSV